MKRLIIILLAASAALFTSCVGRPGLDGRDGRDGIDGVGSIRTVVIDVDTKDWHYSDREDNNYFYAIVDEMPEITLNVFREGLVKMYRVFDFENPKIGAQVELPYSRHKEVVWGPKPDERALFTETVDYEFSVGSVTLFYTASDFDYEYDLKFQPESMQFRCIIMY